MRELVSVCILWMIIFCITSSVKAGEIHDAVRSGDMEKIMELLDRKSYLVNNKNFYNYTPLHCAVVQNSKEIVKLLIDKGADVNAKDDYNYIPLHLAVKNEPQFIDDRATNIDIIKCLLSKGADINARDNDGKTPLHLAAGGNSIEVVQVLVSRGADINEKDNDGSTPLHLAVDSNTIEVVKFLVYKGAKLDAKDNNGMTPFSYISSLIHSGIFNGSPPRCDDEMLEEYNSVHEKFNFLSRKEAELNFKKKIIEFLLIHRILIITSVITGIILTYLLLNHIILFLKKKYQKILNLK